MSNGIYGGYNLRRGDRDDQYRYAGVPRTAPADVIPAPGATPFIEQLQYDLLELGFSLVGTADGIFGSMTEWAVREFQIYAKMPFLAQEIPATSSAPARYVDRLSQVAT